MGINKPFKIISPTTIFILVLALILICCPVTVSGQNYVEGNMTMSQDGVDMIKNFEGFAKYPYWDYSQYTVGYGTHCPSEDLARYQKDGITEEEAEALLREYITAMEETLNTFIKRYGWQLNQAQFDALGSFTYNCGALWLYNSTGIRTAINNGVTGVDFVQELSRWCNAGGQVVPGLINRRLCEGKLYTDGVYSNTRPSEYSYVYLNVGDGKCDYKVYIFDNTTDTPFEIKASLDDADFLGWFTSRENGQQVTSLNNTLKSGSTIYACYKMHNNTQVPVQPMPDEPTTPPTEETTPDTEETEPNETVAQKLTVTGDYVNVRESHSTSSRVCGYVVRGDILEVTEIVDVQGTYWGKTNKGWVCLTYTNYKPTEDDKSDEQPDTTPEIVVETEKVDLDGVIYNCNHLNVRVGPGTNNNLIGQIKSGTQVKITERALIGSTYWGKIDQGWISMDYVQIKTGTTTETVLYTGVVKNCDALNVRKGAGTNNERCGMLYPGTTIMIYETTTVSGTEWGRCDAGWVSLDYVTLTKQETSNESEPSEPEVPDTSEDATETPPPEVVEPETPDVSETTPPASEETETPDETTPEEEVPAAPQPEEDENDSSQGSSEASSLVVTVTQCTGLNIRESYSTKSNVVKILRSKDQIIILEQKYVDDMVWGRCDLGWVSMKYVDFDATNPLNGKVMAGSLRIRQGAGMTYGVVDYYKLNDMISITEITRVGETNWGKTNKGWISMDYIIIQ